MAPKDQTMTIKDKIYLLEKILHEARTIEVRDLIHNEEFRLAKSWGRRLGSKNVEEDFMEMYLEDGTYFRISDLDSIEIKEITFTGKDQEGQQWVMTPYNKHGNVVTRYKVLRTIFGDMLMSYDSLEIVYDFKSDQFKCGKCETVLTEFMYGEEVYHTTPIRFYLSRGKIEIDWPCEEVSEWGHVDVLCGHCNKKLGRYQEEMNVIIGIIHIINTARAGTLAKSLAAALMVYGAEVSQKQYYEAKSKRGDL